MVIGLASGGDKKDDKTTAAGSSTSSSRTSCATPTTTPSPTLDPAVVASQQAAAARASAFASAAAAAASASAAAAAEQASASASAAAEQARVGTLSEQNAHASALSYLQTSSFSRRGLLEQLTSSAGEGFPRRDAEFAVERVEKEGMVNWNERAAQSAKQYLKTSSFSRAGLLEQLTSSAGEGFTQSQALYGLKAVGY